MKYSTVVVLIMSAFFSITCAANNPRYYIDTNLGRIVLELYPNKARFTRYALRFTLLILFQYPVFLGL